MSITPGRFHAAAAGAERASWQYGADAEEKGSQFQAGAAT